ncbi:MAG: STAS domain-containing protein [bacterium]|nr:STAS domain-containing protein [bacterium]
MDIEYRDIGDYKVLKVNGEVNLYNINELKKALFSLTDSNNLKVAIDMKNVIFIDSSIIGALISMHKKMKALNGQFVMLNINNDLMHILQQGSLDKYFAIFNDEDQLI